MTIDKSKQILVKLNKVFCDIFDDNRLIINRTTTAKDIEEWDSLSHVKLILAVENEFEIRFATAELTRFENVGQLVDMIDEKLSA